MSRADYSKLTSILASAFVALVLPFGAITCDDAACLDRARDLATTNPNPRGSAIGDGVNVIVYELSNSTTSGTLTVVSNFA